MKPRLLIADDDAELCQLYGRFLAERGYEVETSTDGLDCLRKLRCRQPAVLVLDLELRWGGGDGVLAWLREQAGPALPAVVLLASGASPEPLTELVVPPVTCCLRKPFSLDALLNGVRTAAAQGQRRSTDRSREAAFPVSPCS
jgi:DNA-binding response OmpR family regulator